jgi:hypothetical protein
MFFIILQLLGFTAHEPCSKARIDSFIDQHKGAWEHE